ncbi:MAG: penicillin acylase family protein [Fimbriimonadaceae bacterium]|nr:penicillin acylase family protein [Chitinophagales bacterium]
MRIGKFLFCIVPVIILIWLFNNSIGSLPPLGKILDPVHGFMANAETEKDFIDQNFNVSYYHESKVNPATISLHINGKIYFDERLVPHIFADDDWSLYFLQGYVHAKYRLWQMETQTRAAGGRLSEVLGKDLLQYDREKRRMGMVVAAENALKELEKDPGAYNCVAAYTQGINEYISRELNNYSSLPVEFKLLDYKPEAWTELKTMLLLKYMANTLTGYDDDVEYTNLLKKLGRKDFDILFPDRPEGIDPIIPSEKKYDFVPVINDTVQHLSEQAYYETMPGKRNTNNGIGSNNWAVAPSKTKNGFPILSNDPHLQLNLPSLWFEIQLHTPTQNVYGASLPGAPGVVIGFNDSISWGLTNGGRDVRDWYAIQFKDDTRNEYAYNNTWKKTEKKMEVIKIKGKEDFIDTVLWTHHGPMVYTNFDTTKRSWNNLAMRWAAIDPSSDFKAFYLLNRAKNYDDYRNALQYYDCPTQNFVFACTNGDIAIIQQGKHAIKYHEEGRFILDGSNKQNDWQQYIPWQQNPFILNPERGFVSSANQHPTDSTYPYYYTGSDFEFFRNRRINDLLSAMQNITVDSLKRIQQDNFNFIASEALPVMFEHLQTTNPIILEMKNSDSFKKKEDLEPKAFLTKNIYKELYGWSYMNNAEIITPTYFQIWYDVLYDSLWDELNDKDIALIKPDDYNHIHAIKNLPGDYAYFDLQSTPDKKETLADIINLAFEITVQKIDSIQKTNPENLKWYLFKHTNIVHLSQLPAFSRANIQNGGYRHIINATSGRNGPSWRMIVEMSSPVNAYGVYPGGQSGNPGSKYFDNFIDDWAAGNYYALHLFSSEEEAKKNTLFSFSFN